MPTKLATGFSRIVPKLSQVASQVLVAVVATGVASILFDARTPAPVEAASAGKFATRIADAAMPAMAMALYPQDIAALSSLDRFKPVAFVPAAAEAASAPKPAPAASRARAVEAFNVLPPPRPKFPDAATLMAAAPDAAPIEPTAQKPHRRLLTIAGLVIPTPSIDLDRYIPTGADVLNTVVHARSAVAWLAHVAAR